MSRRKKPTPVPVGVFRPLPPHDSQEVVHLFAVAARVVCAQPESLGPVTVELSHAVETLVPPESFAAEECGRLWQFFGQALRHPKPQLVVEAGRAIYRDLESMGQRLDLPPLVAWDRLPQGLDGRPNEDTDVNAERWLTLEQVQAEAAQLSAKKRAAAGLKPAEVVELIRKLAPGERDQAFEKMVGGGVIGRADAGLVVRWLAKGEKISDDDEALVEVLEMVGNWLGAGRTGASG